MTACIFLFVCAALFVVGFAVAFKASAKDTLKSERNFLCGWAMLCSGAVLPVAVLAMNRGALGY